MQALNFGVDKLPKYLDLVDIKIREQSTPDILGMDRMLKAKGKRLRPSLVIAVAHHYKKDIDARVIEAAAAVELVHLASLIHDDIIDNGAVRWGQPSINSKEGADSAILTGDYLIARGIALATQADPKAGQMLAETVTALCIGQAQELQDRYNLGRTTDSLLTTVKAKTSSMFKVSLEIGAQLCGVESDQKDIMGAFSENFGIAFQLFDDITDLTKKTEAVCKSVGLDLQEGNYTLPVLLSLKGQRKNELKDLLKKSTKDIAPIMDILILDGSVEAAIVIANSYKQRALQDLKELENIGLSQALNRLINAIE